MTFKNKPLLLQLVKAMKKEDIITQTAWFGLAMQGEKVLYDGKTGCICGWVAIQTGMKPNDLKGDIHQYWKDKFGESIFGDTVATVLGQIHGKYVHNEISFEQMKEQAIKYVEGIE